MRARPRHTRSALRRPFFHGRQDDRDLLPAGVPGSPGEGWQCEFLPVRGGGRGGRLSALPEMSARSCAIFASVERLTHDGGARTSSHRWRCSRRGGRRRPSGASRDRNATTQSALSAALKRKPNSGRPNDPRAKSKAVARRDRAIDGGDRHARRLRQPSAFQRGLRGSLSATADRDTSCQRRSAEETSRRFMRKRPGGWKITSRWRMLLMSLKPEMTAGASVRGGGQCAAGRFFGYPRQSPGVCRVP